MTDIVQPVTPTVSRIVAAIEDRIHSRRYENGEWLPTERALGEEFGVSRATIRRALEELERRRLLVRAAGCRPLVRTGTPVAGAPSGLRRVAARRSLGLWISSDPTDMGASLTTLGVQRALDHAAFRLVVASPYGESYDEAIAAESDALLRMADDADVDGILLWYLGGGINLFALEALRSASIPLVFLDRKPPQRFEADYVGVDNRAASEGVMSHLLSLGHRIIGHVTDPSDASTVLDRQAGYKRGLERAGIPYRPELVVTESEVGQMMSTPQPPTAVFCVNDHTAFAVIQRLQHLGLCVPEDVAVAGFDDQERAQLGAPFLTTVRQPFERIGAEGVRLLLERARGGQPVAYRHVLLDAPLIVRESTAT